MSDQEWQRCPTPRSFNLWRVSLTYVDCIEIKLPGPDKKIGLCEAVKWEKLKRFRWFAFYHHGTWYVKTGDRGMHQMLLPKSNNVDHRNGNGLDNRMSNLSAATHKIQSNNRKLVCTNKSGVNGVSFDTQKNRWVASWREDEEFHSAKFKAGKTQEDYDKARYLAIEFRRSIDQRLGILNGLRPKETSDNKPIPRSLYLNNTSGIKGVKVSVKRSSWIAQMDIKKHRLVNEFKYGPLYDRTQPEAKALAIAQRQAWEREYRNKQPAKEDHTDYDDDAVLSSLFAPSA